MWGMCGFHWHGDRIVGEVAFKRRKNDPLRMGESLKDFPLPLGVHLSVRTPLGMKRQAMRTGSPEEAVCP